MNERIFKLALEAMDFQGAVDTDTELKLTNSELEKFAELIVAECARVANDSNQSKNRAAGVSVGDVVREHFGVDK